MPFSVELDQSIIAAVLTVVGYDINDTVVVYDRIRELDTEHHNKKMTPAEIFNLGINQTLSRTVITGVTTIASSFILFFFGGEVIQGFMLSMIIGFIVGVFTSIFIACPISVDLLMRTQNQTVPKSLE
jgi:preprotein translocase SecF subunit